MHPIHRFLKEKSYICWNFLFFLSNCNISYVKISFQYSILNREINNKVLKKYLYRFYKPFRLCSSIIIQFLLIKSFHWKNFYIVKFKQNVLKWKVHKVHYYNNVFVYSNVLLSFYYIVQTIITIFLLLLVLDR